MTAYVRGCGNQPPGCCPSSLFARNLVVQSRNTHPNTSNAARHSHCSTMTTTKAISSPLIAPLKVGQLQLNHRVVMSAMTRLRGDPKTWAPNQLVAKYYTQRTSQGGLILTECTAVSPSARGYVRAPNMYDDYSLAGWVHVVRGVHAHGGFIFNQLFHAGRVSHTSFMPDNSHIVGASDLPMSGTLYTANGIKESYSVPWKLSTDQVGGVVRDFANAARTAVKDVGFNGVEIHAGNGYLVQQFMAAKTNTRSDKYGGGVPNRMRFLLEVIDAVAAEVGYENTAVKLQPGVTFSDLVEPLEDVKEQLKFLAPELSKRKLAYVCVSSVHDEPYSSMLGLAKPNAHSRQDVWEPFRSQYTGVLMVNGGLSIEAGAELVKAGVTDLVAFGVPFIANANLAQLIAAGCGTKDLNPGGWDTSRWYSKDPSKDVVGFTDWPLEIPHLRSRDD